MKHALLCLAALLFAAPAFADGVEIKSAVEKEVATFNAQGLRETHVAPAAKAVPGDTLIVRLGYANTSDKPIANVTISNSVPAHLQFAGAREGGEPAYSVDGGKTFGPLEQLSVLVSGNVFRPARLGDVTTVRWRLDHALAPGATGEFAFAARLQ